MISRLKARNAIFYLEINNLINYCMSWNTDSGTRGRLRNISYSTTPPTWQVNYFPLDPTYLYYARSRHCRWSPTSGALA